MIVLLRVAEGVSAILLLYFGLSLSPTTHPLTMLVLLVEAGVACYITWAVGRYASARTIAVLLAVLILVPMVVSVMRGALGSSVASGPAVLLSFVLVGLLGVGQLVSVAALVMTRTVRGASA